jgi:sn-glycerol 3-phosphate transport system permease protein
LAAYAFAFLDFRFKKQIFALFLITMMLPFEAQIIPNFQTVRTLGWLDSYAGLTIPFFASAFGVFMLRQAFLQVPNELHEYSQLIGLNHLQFLFRIVLPYSRSTIVTFVLYMFLTHWNDYLWPLITTFTDQYRTTQVGLKQLQAQDTFSNWGVIMATAILILLPTLIVLIIGQCYFRKGLNTGGLKA